MHTTGQQHCLQLLLSHAGSTTHHPLSEHHSMQQEHSNLLIAESHAAKTCYVNGISRQQCERNKQARPAAMQPLRRHAQNWYNTPTAKACCTSLVKPAL
jgi:hypothetical protein